MLAMSVRCWIKAPGLTEDRLDMLVRIRAAGEEHQKVRPVLVDLRTKVAPTYLSKDRSASAFAKS